jgi:hypothetical protein
MNCHTCNLFLKGICNPKGGAVNNNVYCVFEVTKGTKPKIHEAYKSGRVPGTTTGGW